MVFLANALFLLGTAVQPVGAVEAEAPAASQRIRIHVDTWPEAAPSNNGMNLTMRRTAKGRLIVFIHSRLAGYPERSTTSRLTKRYDPVILDS